MISNRLPLVLLHGFAGHAESWAALRRCVPEGRKVTAPPLPGHDPRALLHPEGGFAEAVEQIARSLTPIAPVHLTGYSMGGRLALGVALERANLVERLTLIGVHPGLASDADLEARRELEERWILQLQTQGTERFFETFSALPLFASQGRLEPGRLAEQSRIRLRHRAADLVAVIRALGLGAMPDYTPRLGELTIPVDLLAGEEDSKFRGLAERMLLHLSGGRFEVFPGAGHNLVLECPVELATVLEETAR